VMSAAQRERVLAAAKGIALRYAPRADQQHARSYVRPPIPSASLGLVHQHRDELQARLARARQGAARHHREPWVTSFDVRAGSAVAVGLRDSLAAEGVKRGGHGGPAASSPAQQC
jgi:hypothetical protein